MSLVDSTAILQALSSYTGVAVKPMTETTKAGHELDVFNFLPTTLVKQGGDEPDSLFDHLSEDLKEFLHPKYDYDFTHLQDTSVCMRGDKPYTRPCGWKRIAIKVLNKYPEGNAWLGIDGWRNYSVGGEWPVTFYGTNMDSVKDIVGSHYKPDQNFLNQNSRGIYSTYDINEAAKYSDQFLDDDTGKTYKVLLQNRINPDKITEVLDNKFWLIKVPEGTTPAQEKKIVEESIRPYGILFKEV